MRRPMDSKDLEGKTVEQLVEMIRLDAIEHAADNGLKGKLKATLEVTDFGFRVMVESSDGSSACCTYQRDGMRSMYELTKAKVGGHYGC